MLVIVGLVSQGFSFILCAPGSTLPLENEPLDFICGGRNFVRVRALHNREESVSGASNEWICRPEVASGVILPEPTSVPNEQNQRRPEGSITRSD